MAPASACCNFVGTCEYGVGVEGLYSSCNGKYGEGDDDVEECDVLAIDRRTQALD